MKSVLEIKQLMVKAFIGVEEYERLAPIELELNITITFANLPVGCSSDDIKNTICYDNLSKKIIEFCAGKHFHLIEYLCGSLHEYLKKSILNQEDILSLEVCKFAPVKEIKGQCCFKIVN
jgi:dihydroneopterin aldolase